MGTARWTRLDLENSHTRVYVVVEDEQRERRIQVGSIKSLEQPGKWTVHARWTLASSDRELFHTWWVDSEAEALRLMDAIAIGVATAIGPAVYVAGDAGAAL